MATRHTKICTANKRNGTRCQRLAVADGIFCGLHLPSRTLKKAEGRIATLPKPPETLDDLRVLVARTLSDTLAGIVEAKEAHAIMQLAKEAQKLFAASTPAEPDPTADMSPAELVAALERELAMAKNRLAVGS